MERKAPFFIRYSDDMLAAAQSEADAKELLRFTKVYMERYGLALDEEKTVLAAAEQGIELLGYHFDETGKSVPTKAETGLQERLEALFLLSPGLSVSEKLKKGMESSGARGYHIWIFFTEWIPVRYINALSRVIEKEAEKIRAEGIDIEYFPDERRVRAGKAGQSIKLPLGIHSKSDKRGCLLKEDLSVVTELAPFLKDIARFSLLAVKKIIDMHAGESRESMQPSLKEHTPDQDLEDFGKLSTEVKTVLERCNLMRYLCQKARKTGYLTHFERQSVLYVFGHMGDEGKEFVHQIMGCTLNYQYQVTQKFIDRIPEKPVSCVKLREQYRQITAEIGCSCNFKRTKNCYPSPVLHALRSADTEDGQITIPSSRSLSKEKEQTVYQEVNVYRKAQELAEKILEMKRQKRGIDKKIAKTERELESVFDGIKADCLEIEMGLLCRRKKADGSYEWVIEI